jgi:acetyl-CoA carboxylase beta subunit
MLDAIVPRHQMRFTLARILAMLTKPRGNRGAGANAGKGKR